MVQRSVVGQRTAVGQWAGGYVFPVCLVMEVLLWLGGWVGGFVYWDVTVLKCWWGWLRPGCKVWLYAGFVSVECVRVGGGVLGVRVVVAVCVYL